MANPVAPARCWIPFPLLILLTQLHSRLSIPAELVRREGICMFLLSAAELRKLFCGDSALHSHGTAVT